MADRRAEALRIEGRAVAELAALHADPLFYGRGVPRGDGRLVVVVPGLFGNDLYLQPLRAWLRRIGYRSQRSTLTINAGCPNRLTADVEAAVRRQLERQLDDAPGPVALVGHSRGGMLSWALASRLGERVSHLALLGSPAPAVVAMFRAGTFATPSTVARSQVAAAGARAMRLLDPDCDVPACACEYVTDLRRALPASTKVLSIRSSDDPIVHPSACRLPAGAGENVEVRGSHGGLAHNRAVYPHLARFLAS